MRTSIKIALTASVLATLSFSGLGAKAEASVAHRRSHHVHSSVGVGKSRSAPAGFLETGTASDPDFASASNITPSLAPAISRRSQIGTASFYHPALVGHLTANGDRYSDLALTAAHRTLDLGTRVRVTNLANSRSVVVTVNDRGPYVRGRIIDLSRRAALMLGFVQQGVARVKIDPLGKSAGRAT